MRVTEQAEATTRAAAVAVNPASPRVLKRRDAGAEAQFHPRQRPPPYGHDPKSRESIHDQAPT